jgi:hypothetical protein
MPTSVNFAEPRPHNRTRVFAEGGTGGLRDALLIAVFSAVGLVCTLVGVIYLSSLVGAAELLDVGQFVSP